MELGLCIEMIFTKHPFLERMKKAAGLGIRNVEMWFVDGSWKGGPEELAAAARDCGVRITNTVIGSPDGSIGGGLTDPSNRGQWLERARFVLDFTKRAGIPASIVCTGDVVPGSTKARMSRSVRDGLKATVGLAEKEGITLLLEPLNTAKDHQGYWLAGSDAGAELCRAVGSERLRLLFDIYHMQIMEGNLLEHIRRNIDVIGHFHSAGVPGRHELWKSEIDYRFLLSEIGALGYRGLFGLEYSPSMDEEASVKKTFEHLAGVL